MYLIGIDLVDVEEVERSMARFGHRYEDRLLGVEERRAFNDGKGSAVSLAELIAAKEATMKVLGPGSRPIDWRSIEVRRTGAGKFVLRLSDSAAELAEAAGIIDIEVSSANNAGHALALAVARLGSAPSVGAATLRG